MNLLPAHRLSTWTLALLVTLGFLGAAPLRADTPPDTTGPRFVTLMVHPAILPPYGGIAEALAVPVDDNNIRSVTAVRKDPDGSQSNALVLGNSLGGYRVYLALPRNTTDTDQVYTVTFTAKDNLLNASEGSVSVTVQSPQTHFAGLYPNQVTLEAGSLQRFSAVNDLRNPIDVPVKWSLSETVPIVADPGTLDADGTYHAPAVVTETFQVNVLAETTDGTPQKAMARIKVLRTYPEKTLLIVRSVTGLPGAKVDLEVTVQAPQLKGPINPSLGYAGLQFDLSYPTSVATLGVADLSNPVEIKFPEVVLPNSQKQVNVTDAGVVKVALVSPVSSFRSGRVVRVPLVLKSDATTGPFPLRIDNLRVFNTQGQPLPSMAVQGTLTVGVRATCGDTDGDGSVAVNDAVMALKAVVGLVTLTPDQVKAADTNGDGAVDAGDVIRILRRAIRLDKGCPDLPTPPAPPAA